MTFQHHHLRKRLSIHIDEAGRGPLAGPVWVGATAVLEKIDTSLFADSKSLSEKKRMSAYAHIQQKHAQGILLAGAGRADAAYIDTHGIIASLHKSCLQAIFVLIKKHYLLTRRAQLLASTYGIDHLAVLQLDRLFRKRKITLEVVERIIDVENTLLVVQSVIIDGNHTFGLDQLSCNVITIIKGDSKNALISAASIIAKVERDTYMKKIAKKFPRYRFEQHKGYGTATHRKAITKHGTSPLHRQTFCMNIKKKKQPSISSGKRAKPISSINTGVSGTTLQVIHEKPKLLLHICCAPDLSRPLHWLKKHFKLYLFWYNPNIHPRPEHEKRYAQFLKLIGLEKGDYEILEDRYDPKEFFDAMFDMRAMISASVKNAKRKEVLQVAGDMAERSDRCNPCYAMRLQQAAKNAAKHKIPYFTSTLLISPRKKMDKLFKRGCDAERHYPGSKFLRFDFAKNEGYKKAGELTTKHGLRRQNYCGCGWTVPKQGEPVKEYTGG